MNISSSPSSFSSSIRIIEKMFNNHRENYLMNFGEVRNRFL